MEHYNQEAAEPTPLESSPHSESFGEVLASLDAHIAETDSSLRSEYGPEGDRLLALINQPA